MDNHAELPSFSKTDIQNVLGSPEGQALIRLLSRDGGVMLKRAADAVKNGNMGLAQEIMREKMESPDAQALIEKLNRK